MNVSLTCFPRSSRRHASVRVRFRRTPHPSRRHPRRHPRRVARRRDVREPRLGPHARHRYEPRRQRGHISPRPRRARSLPDHLRRRRCEAMLHARRGSAERRGEIRRDAGVRGRRSSGSLARLSARGSKEKRRARSRRVWRPRVVAGRALERETGARGVRGVARHPSRRVRVEILHRRVRGQDQNDRARRLLQF